MECEVMQKLKLVEEQARKDCNTETVYELQAVYGQQCLEAKRLQSFHYDRCSICQELTANV